MATITRTPYGTYTHGVPVYRERAYDRFDVWTSSRNPCPGEGDRLACASAADDSPIWRGPYAATCACCWLGHGHTTAYHERAVKAHGEPPGRGSAI